MTSLQLSKYHLRVQNQIRLYLAGYIDSNDFADFVHGLSVYGQRYAAANLPVFTRFAAKRGLIGVNI